MTRICRLTTTILLLCQFLLYSCSGEGQSPGPGASTTGPGIDGDFVQGNTSNYYRSEGSNKAMVISINEDRGEAKRLEITGGQVRVVGSLSVNELRFSNDRSIVAIRRENQIYELAIPTPDTVAKSPEVLLLSDIEMYCRVNPLDSTANFSGASYNEVVIHKSGNDRFQLTKVGSQGRETSSQILTRTESDSKIRFLSGSSIVLEILKDNPLVQDPAYYVTNGLGLSDIACHLNRTESPPSVGTGISFFNLTSSTVTATWGRANDAITPSTLLEYKLVTDTTFTNVNSISKVEAVTGAGLIVDWTVDLTPQIEVVGLLPNTNYYFGLLVRDRAGNISMYPVAVVYLP